MTEAEILLAITQGLIAILVATGGFLLRRAMDDSREATRQVVKLRERVVRIESQVGGIDRLESKIDALSDDIRDVRERVASWAGPRVS
jgi:cation transport ATPase